MDEKKQSKGLRRIKRMRSQLINQFDSVKEWRAYCFKTHRAYIKNPHFRKWVKQKEIDIFDFSKLKKRDIQYIKIGMNDAIKSAKLHFKVHEIRDKKFHLDWTKNDILISDEILKMAIKKRKNHQKQNANVYLFNHALKTQDAIIKDGEALTYVSEGVMMFSFDSNISYASSFFRRRAKHEALHLLGLNFHHEDIEVKGYKNVPCVMSYNAPTQNLCRKCKDALLYFWKGIKHATEK